MDSFPAIVATEQGPASLTEVLESSLPEGDVTVDVHWSSLNYKDGLAVTGKGRIARSFPMVCGVDLAGTVRVSDDARWSPGDEVVATGWGLSETHPGGYTTRQRLRGEWLVARPPELSLRETMAIGDNWNDVDMMEWAAQAVVMGNAAVELRTMAKTRGWKQAPQNDQDGVAVVLERLIKSNAKAPARV